jgi:hypothetical protein
LPTLCEKCTIDFLAIMGYNKSVPRERKQVKTSKKIKKNLKKVLTKYKPCGIIKIQKGKESQEKNFKKV